MQTEIEKIQSQITGLRTQQGNVGLQIDEIRLRAGVIEEQQKQISVAAFSGNSEALSKFEELSEEIIKLARQLTQIH